jgi:hypothetical protein
MAKTEKLAKDGRYNIINHIVALYHFTTKIDELFKDFFIYCGCYIYFKYRHCKEL